MLMWTEGTKKRRKVSIGGSKKGRRMKKGKCIIWFGEYIKDA